MPSPSTYTTVPKAVAEEVKASSSTRKAWLQAIKNGEVIVMGNRPSLTKSDKEVLDREGYKMRTRYTNDNDENESEVYVWLEYVAGEPPLDPETDYMPAEPPVPSVDEAVEDVIGALPQELS